jgi:internalin A
LSALAGLVALETLSVAETKVSDLSALGSLTALKSLDLTETQVSDLSSLRSLRNLEMIAMSRETPKALVDTLGLPGELGVGHRQATYHIKRS